MKADTVTIPRINDLAALLITAASAMQRLAIAADKGEVSVKEAAEEINETMRLLAIAAE
jgi:hypothetical protein